MSQDNGLENIVNDNYEWFSKVSKYPDVSYYDFDQYKVSDSYYKTAIETINKIKYTKDGVIGFCNLLGGDRKGIVGLYISALINNIIKENEKIVIRPNLILNCWGYRHSKGILVIEGHAGDFTGSLMSGGELIIEGNTGRYSCSGMRGGKLVVNGKMMSIAFDVNGGEIWECNRKIYLPKPFFKSALKRLGWGIYAATKKRED